MNPALRVFIDARVIERLVIAVRDVLIPQPVKMPAASENTTGRESSVKQAKNGCGDDVGRQDWALWKASSTFAGGGPLPLRHMRRAVVAKIQNGSSLLDHFARRNPAEGGFAQ